MCDLELYVIKFSTFHYLEVFIKVLEGNIATPTLYMVRLKQRKEQYFIWQLCEGNLNFSVHTNSFFALKMQVKHL